MNDGDGNMNDLPKWAAVVLKVGFPVAAASLLLWFVLFNVTSELNSIRAAQTQSSIDTQSLKNTMDGLKNSVEALTNSNKAEQVRSNLFLQQICINGSAARDRVNCLR